MDESEECDHVARPNVPWRTDRFTQCGQHIDDVASVLSLADLESRIQRDGHAQTVITMCRTCWDSRDTARWESNPVGVVAREAVRVGIGSREPSTRPEARRFNDELRAIAALIEAHRSEFDAYLNELDASTHLTDRRRMRAGSGESTSQGRIPR